MVVAESFLEILQTGYIIAYISIKVNMYNIFSLMFIWGFLISLCLIFLIVIFKYVN